MPLNKQASRSTKKQAKNKHRAQRQRTDAGAAENAEDAAAQQNRVTAAQQNGIAAGSRAMGQQQQSPSMNNRSLGAVPRAREQGAWQGARAARDADADADGIAAAALAAAGDAAGSAPVAAGLTPAAIAAGHACESARLRAQGRLRELFTGSSSALKIALIARGAAFERCLRLQRDDGRLGPAHQAAQRDRERCLEQVGQASIAAMESSAFARAASRAAVEAIEGKLAASELEHDKRDAFLVEHLIKPVVTRVGGPIGAATLECSLLTLKQLRRGEVTGNGEDRDKSYEDGEEHLDLDPPVYLSQAFLERMRKLDDEQRALRANLPRWAYDFEDAFCVANAAARGLIEAAREAAVGVPDEVPFQMLFAKLDDAVFLKMMNTFSDAAETTYDRIDCLFYALTKSAQRHCAKDRRDKKLLECLRDVSSSPRTAASDSAAVEAILKEFDSANVKGGAASSSASSSASAASTSPALPLSASSSRHPSHAAQAAADAVAVAVTAVLGLRSAFAIMDSGPASVDTSSFAQTAAGVGSAADGNVAAGEGEKEDVRTYSEGGYEIFADHWPAPAPRTPELVTETRYKAAPATRSAPRDVDLLDLADDEWQGDDGEDSDDDDDIDKDEPLAKFRRLQVSPLERLPMEIAAGEAPYKRRRRRTDADLHGLAQSVRCRIGPPGSDRAAEEHISYAAFMEACPPPPGVIPGHNATPKNNNGPDINERRRQQRLARVREERAAAFAAARAKAEEAARAKAEEAAAAAATAGTAATTAAGDGVIESLVMTLTPSAPQVPPPPAVFVPATAASLADDADADPAHADTN